MQESFKQFLRDNMQGLDEVGLNTLQAGLEEHDAELKKLQDDIASKQSKIDELNLANMNLNRTNIDLVLRMTGAEPTETQEDKEQRILDSIPSLADVIKEWK